MDQHLRFYENNPSALWMQVELICRITDMGLNSGDVHIKSKIPMNFIGNLNNLLVITPSNPQARLFPTLSSGEPTI